MSDATFDQLILIKQIENCSNCKLIKETEVISDETIKKRRQIDTSKTRSGIQKVSYLSR